MPLKVTDNGSIIDAIRSEASVDYIKRVPLTTEAGIDAAVAAITRFTATRNEFLDALVNRIGSVIAHDISWSNPLAQFKRESLTYGSTIEEIQVGLIQAQPYNADRNSLEHTLFGQHTPDVQANYHTVNRENYYPITVNEGLLRRAFTSTDGLSKLIAQILQAPTTSDSWDEFLLMCKLFPIYEKNGGYFHVNVPDVRASTSTEADAKKALRKMRAMAENLTFLSSHYNAAHMPVYARPEELCLFVSPEFNAAIDVEALAGAFNISKAEMTGRIIPIPQEQFGVDGMQALMTTRNFFVVADTRLENSSQWNAAKLSSNYFFHHWEIISASRFVPAVAFGTFPDDEIIEIKTVVNAIKDLIATDETQNPNVTVKSLARGNKYQLSATVTTAPTGGTNVGVKYEIQGANDDATNVSSNGVIYVSPAETATSIDVIATTTWIDPANVDDSAKATKATFTLTGDIIPEWGKGPKVVTAP